MLQLRENEKSRSLRELELEKLLMEQKELQVRMVAMIRGLRREHRLLRAQAKFERSMRESPPSPVFSQGPYFATRDIEANRQRQELAWSLHEGSPRL